MGSYLVTDLIPNTNNGPHVIYTSGDILACFLGIVYGVFSLGIAAPNFKAIAEGRVAGKLAFDIMEREPSIKIDEGKPVGDVKGRIEFKDVTFEYPSRPGQKILDNFSAVFE